MDTFTLRKLIVFLIYDMYTLLYVYYILKKILIFNLKKILIWKIKFFQIFNLKKFYANDIMHWLLNRITI